MIHNKWSDKVAKEWCDAAPQTPADQALALRVYTSRLIGMDPDLVMHGGGNTSVKVRRENLFGDMEDVLHVKGSGWDLEVIEAAGLPGVRLEPLKRLRTPGEWCGRGTDLFWHRHRRVDCILVYCAWHGSCGLHGRQSAET